MSDTLNRIYTVENLYINQQHISAAALAADTAKFIDDELSYIVSLDPELKAKYTNEARIGMYVLNGLDQITAAYHDKTLNAQIKSRFIKFQSQL